uniref:Uncharacterized protein n=1 Tax=Anopheles melas TaxID=34690 RepID=A0A182TZJ2_9DIPT
MPARSASPARASGRRWHHCCPQRAPHRPPWSTVSAHSQPLTVQPIVYGSRDSAASDHRCGVPRSPAMVAVLTKDGSVSARSPTDQDLSPPPAGGTGGERRARTIPARVCRAQGKQTAQEEAEEEDEEDEEEEDEEEDEDDGVRRRTTFGLGNEGDDEGENDSEEGGQQAALQPPAAASQPDQPMQQRRIRRLRSRGRSANYQRRYRARGTAEMTSPAATGSGSPPDSAGRRCRRPTPMPADDQQEEEEEEEDVGVEYAVLLPDSFAVLDSSYWSPAQ